MKNLIIFIGIGLLAISLLQACGPDEEQLRQQEMAEEQARQDSLALVYEAEMEQMRQDSIALAQQMAAEEAEAEAAVAAEAAAEERERATAVTFSENGPLTVQIQSWRSEVKAEEQARLWQDRGFEHAYVVKYGDDEIGDVWFRVRMGNVPNRTMAVRLKEKLATEYSVESWIANTEN